MDYKTYYKRKRRSQLSDRAIIMEFAQENPLQEQRFRERYEQDEKKLKEIMSIQDTLTRHKKMAENMYLFE